MWVLHALSGEASLSVAAVSIALISVPIVPYSLVWRDEKDNKERRERGSEIYNIELTPKREKHIETTNAPKNDIYTTLSQEKVEI